jgi:hypothetical protein
VHPTAGKRPTAGRPSFLVPGGIVRPCRRGTPAGRLPLQPAGGRTQRLPGGTSPSYRQGTPADRHRPAGRRALTDTGAGKLGEYFPSTLSFWRCLHDLPIVTASREGIDLAADGAPAPWQRPARLDDAISHATSLPMASSPMKIALQGTMHGCMKESYRDRRRQTR